MRPLLRIAATGMLLAAVSCSNGATLGTVVPTPAPIALQAKLQFTVGTATIGYPGGTWIGTNVVATFRGANGHSATLVNTPTITGPSNFAIGYPGTPNSLAGILPNVYDAAIISAAATNTSLPLSFGNGLGPFVGVFGYGLAADNLVSSQVGLDYQAVFSRQNLCLDATASSQISAGNVQGTAQINVIGRGATQVTSEAQSNELGVPFGYGQGVAAFGPPGCQVYPNYQTPAGASNNLPINYYGGPPAWPSAQGYGQPTFFVGYPLGFTAFAAPPVLGNYSLDVAYPTNQSSTTYGHFDATTTLRSIQPLPPIIITKAVFNSDGTEAVTLTVPAGVTETVVTLRVTGCSSGTQPASNYSIVTHSTGTQTVLFPANIGPPDSSGRPIPTVCPGAFGFAAAVGFDYPAYESSYPFNISQTPTIANAQGQADVTTSAPVSFNIGS